MTKTILITGATDGIGLLTAQMLAKQGQHMLLHGRSEQKLEAAMQTVGHNCEGYLADLSDLGDVKKLADEVKTMHTRLDVLINNAGIFKTSQPLAGNGMDVRFVVNTFAPYLLTQELLPIIPADGRVINLSSAAQAPVDLSAFGAQGALDDMEAYAQSKLAITIWSQEMARAHSGGPVFIAVNPGSLLASKMVKEGFGVAGSDLAIGATILSELALEDKHASASGRYFDNDAGRFDAPHPWASDPRNAEAVMKIIAEKTA